MSRFASKELRTIDLGDGEWVKIPAALSYATVIAINGQKDETEVAKSLLTQCIKEWNIKNDEEIVPELNEENILALDIETITIISTELTKMITNNQDKKK